jgi:hypothetical protein
MIFAMRLKGTDLAQSLLLQLKFNKFFRCAAAGEIHNHIERQDQFEGSASANLRASLRSEGCSRSAKLHCLMTTFQLSKRLSPDHVVDGIKERFFLGLFFGNALMSRPPSGGTSFWDNSLAPRHRTAEPRPHDVSLNDRSCENQREQHASQNNPLS